MKQPTPPSNELATRQDQDRFVLPYMTPDEIDDFVTFILDAGHQVREYELASDSFRRSLYRTWKSRQKK